MAATYLELFGFLDHPEIRRRLQMAAFFKAGAVLVDANSTNPQKIIANKVLAGDVPNTELRLLATRALLSSAVRNNGTAVSDADLQTIVDAEFFNVFK